MSNIKFPVRGQAQVAIMDTIADRVDQGSWQVGSSSQIADLMYHSPVFFGKLVAGARALAKRGWIEWDGSRVKVTQKTVDYINQALSGRTASMNCTLQSKIIRLAHTNPSVRAALREAGILDKLFKRYKKKARGSNPLSYRRGES